jgi:adenylate cyclase
VGVKHRLLAILAADVAGYSRLVAADDVGAVQALDAAREVFRHHVAAHEGRVIDMAGDSVLAVFDTATGAVSAALAIQQALTARAAEMPAPRRMLFRIGIHLGDVLEKSDGTIYGDGVNIAARLQALAEPGGVTVSHAVREAVFNRIGAAFDDLGEQTVKNIDQPVHAFRMRWERMAGTVEALGGAIGGRGLRITPRAWPRTLQRHRLQATLVVVLALAAAAAWWWRAAPSSAARANEPPTMSVAIAPFKAAPGIADGEQQAASIRRDLALGLSALEHHLVRLVQTDAAGAVPRVRYLVEGDLEPGPEGRASLALQMFDVRAGEQIWSRRFDIPAPDGDALPIFRRTIVRTVREAAFFAELRRIAALRPEQMDAMELTLRAWAVFAESRTLASARQSRALLDAALRKDPTLVYAWSMRSDILDLENDVDPHPDHDRLAREMDELSTHATMLDPSAPRIWYSRSQALADGGRWNEAVEATDQAIRLDPYGRYYGAKAWLMSMMGRPAEALPLAARQTALDPDDTWAPRVACEAHLLLGQAAEAVTGCEKAAALDTDWIVQLFLAAAYANLGDLAKAKAAKDKALLTVPGYTISQLRAKRYSEVPEYLKMAEANWYAGLRKAGLPD